jgi:hypothetical protein
MGGGGREEEEEEKKIKSNSRYENGGSMLNTSTCPDFG